MINFTLYKHEVKRSWKLMLIFGAILTLYVSVIISMFDPELAKTLDQFTEVLPELMSAVGMRGGETTLIGFILSYLYGMILLVFPMVMVIIRANSLVAKYVDNGSMVTLTAAPVRRSTVALTQLLSLLTCVAILLTYVTALEIGVAEACYPGELDTAALLKVNLGLFCLQLFIAGICFLSSCAFSEAKHSIAVGAGVPTLMYIIKMLANMGGSSEKMKYLTFFSLFNPEGLAAGEAEAFIYAAILFVGAIVMFALGITAFSKKDLHI